MKLRTMHLLTLALSFVACDAPGDVVDDTIDTEAVDASSGTGESTGGEAPSNVAPIDDLAAEPDVDANGYLNQPHVLVNVASGLCIDAPNNVANTNVQQYWCHYGPSQKWEFLIDPLVAKFRIRNVWSNLCLDTVNAQFISLQPCGAWPSQYFDETSARGTSLIAGLFKQHGTSTCIDVPSGSRDPVAIQKFACHSGTSQQFVYTVQP